MGLPVKTFKTTWEHSFKWKPPEYNTIDFLVTVNKNKSNEDEIGNKFTSGLSTNLTEDIEQFKIVTLRVGFNQQIHGYINPFMELLENKLLANYGRHDDYKPVPFIPTNPYDQNAHICHIPITIDKNGFKQMFTEEGDIIEDHMIVEFKYDKAQPGYFKWVPLRTRPDKTSEYRRGLKNFGNSYATANSNWSSIHNPITERIIRTGNNIPTQEDNDVYYNKNNNESETKPLRNFHNLYVKRVLLRSVIRPNDKLIDFAVGKGGDIPKFVENRLRFVYGIDISKDNIENRIDGVCARYLNSKKKNRNIFKAIFLPGDSSLNIKNGESFSSERAKNTNAALLGLGPKDKTILGENVYESYGIGKGGFDVGTIQFAIHYMFESVDKLHHFLKNVSENIKVGGYFVGTTYDGEEVFKYLKNVNKGESKTLMVKNKKIWEIQKQYDVDVFEDNYTSLGYAVDIYQETINKYFREYLVNFKYLTRMMEDYGFIVLAKEEASKIGMYDGIGSFKHLFQEMELLIKKNERHRSDYGESLKMTPEEQTISFLNKYFIYKKIRNVDTKRIFKIHTKQSDQDEALIYKPKKLKRRLKLVE